MAEYLTYNKLLKPSNKVISPKAMDIREHPARNMPSSSYWNYTHDVPQPTYTPEGILRGSKSMAAMEEHHWDNMELHNSEVNTN